MGTTPWTDRNEKVLTHCQHHHNQPQPPASPNTASSLGISGPKPETLGPDKDNGLENTDINGQTIGDEGAVQQRERAQDDGQCACQSADEKSNKKVEEPEIETAITETATKRLEEEGHAKEPTLPIDEDWGWEIVDLAIKPEVGEHTAHESPVDDVGYEIFGKASGEHPDPAVKHPQHVDSSSNLPRKMEEKATRPKNPYEPRFSSFHAMANIPQQHPKYADKSTAESSSRLSRARLLLPEELSGSGE